MKELGIGLIGTGFMGKAHAFAYRAALAAFPDIPVPRLEMIADVNADLAARAAHQYGFARSSGDWRALVNDPRIDVVSITTPNTLHKEMALAAIAAGKHVHCEKPLSPSLADSLAMVEAAEKKGVVTQVGFNYIKNPLLKQARDMIVGGELGEITGFRGIHAEDYMHDPESPYTWRIDPVGGPGVIADLGSHIICMARFLLGPIVEVSADVRTVVRSRPVAVFTQERLNELLYYRAGGGAKTNGYMKIEAGPQHPPYGEFCIAGGHQLGFNDLKTIEMGEFLRAIGGGGAAGPDFREAYEIQKVVEAAIASSKARVWVAVD